MRSTYPMKRTKHLLSGNLFLSSFTNGRPAYYFQTEAVDNMNTRVKGRRSSELFGTIWDPGNRQTYRGINIQNHRAGGGLLMAHHRHLQRTCGIPRCV